MRVITARFHEYPALENTPETDRSVKSRAGQGNAFIKVVTNTTSHRCRCPKRSRHFEIITRPSSSYKPRGAITFVREIARIKRACFVNEKRFCEWEVARVSASGKPSFYRPRGTNVASKMFLFTVRERETERERERNRFHPAPKTIPIMFILVFCPLLFPSRKEDNACEHETLPDYWQRSLLVECILFR